MIKVQIKNDSILKKNSQLNNDQHSVIGGHVGNDLDAEELDLYRFMLGGLLPK